MSDSPQSAPKDVEPGVQSPDGDEQMNESQDPQSAGLMYEFEVKEQDRWLPIANVARIMKNALPDNAKIAKEAKECMQECVSEFISFITSEASEKCHQEKRKTVNGEDILFAMTSLGFENYAEALKIYLAKYRDQSQTNRNDNQQRPGSQGYGASSAGPSGAGQNYPGADGAGGLLGAQQGEPGGDASGFMYAPQSGHNGAAPEGPY
ncbi:hypothetical protein VUR80DRAFT_4379 [Thermomyces stellatus]